MIRERYAWGPVLPYDQALAEFRALQARPWDLRPRVVDAGVTEEYTQYRAGHPILRILDLAEPIPAFEDERGRRRRRAGGRGDGGGVGGGGGGDGGDGGGGGGGGGGLGMRSQRRGRGGLPLQISQGPLIPRGVQLSGRVREREIPMDRGEGTAGEGGVGEAAMDTRAFRGGYEAVWASTG